MSLIVGTAVAGGGSAPYQISRSLRFNPADTAYLNRTLGTSNRRTFTFSAWVKRSLLTSDQHLLGAINFAGGGSTNQQFGIVLAGGDYLNVFHYNNGTYQYYPTAALYRDVSAWYHFVIAVDTTQATGSNRVKIYANGVLQATSGAVDITQNTDLFINCGFNTGIGTQVGTGLGNSYYFGGYMAEVYFIDGQQLTPSSFGQTNPNTGVWEPINYAGTYGTNGFELSFADNSGATSTTLGKDTSGNGNNWTPNNFSVTAGAGNDSLVDTPTNYGTDTGIGGSVRGNYATLNPLAVTYGTSFSNGNLKVLMNGANTSIPTSTIAVSSGKWYAEMLVESTNSGTRTYPLFGICNPRTFGDPAFLGDTADEYSYSCDGYKTNNNVATSVGTTLTTNDIMMLAFDADSGKIWWGKNGTWIASGDPATGANAMYSSIPSSTYVLALCGYTSTNATVNFGQRAFAYTAPSGFKALCTTNLPTPTIGATSTTQANDYFNPVLYSGNSSTQNITGVGFAPDMVWLKVRNDAQSHRVFDTVRGASQRIIPNSTAAEANTPTELNAFGSDGFTLGNNTDVNGTGFNYVAWNWNAGGSTVTNTSGTISAQVRANTTSRFSIVTYTGTGSNATVGHGLGIAPSMIIVKRRNGVNDWPVYHVGQNATPQNGLVYLNATNAYLAASNVWNNTAPTSSVFSIGTNGALNLNTATYVAYCFAPVAGYSAFGSYTGNGSTDGPFVYTNFRPRFILWKRSDGAESWWINDTSRLGYNGANQALFPNLSNAENTANNIDILSNGFKIRGSGGEVNASGGTYIYAAFAESPFKYSLAR